MAAEDRSPAAPAAAQELHAPQQLSAWLRLMLAEIAAKREQLEQARAEQRRRERESGGNPG